MSLVNRSLSRAWVVVPLLAGLLVSGIDARRAGRVEHVTALGLASGAPAGDGAIRPALIVPERDAATFATLGRAERLLARGEWRVRRTDEENAPFGRDIHATSPQAWSFALAAWVDHALGGRPIGAAIERAALWFEPALHLLLLAATVVLAAWRFGAWAAVLGSVALATFYPLGAGFLPGVPGGEGLARAIAFGGALLLLAGLRDRARAACWFAAAGMGAGLALWIDARVGLVFLGGAAAGGIGVAWLERGRIGAVRDARAALPWRAWSLAGATTILAGYLIEYAPGQLAGWRLGYIHPIYAVAWIGTAEWLRSIAGGVSGKGSAGRIVALGLAAAAVVAPAALVWSGAGPWPAPDLSLFRLTAEPAGVIAANVWSWLVRDGFNAIVLATLLPLTTIAGAGWVLLRRATPPEVRETVLLAGGPVIVAVAVAARHIGAWPSVDLALVLLLIAAAPAATTKLARASWAGLIAVCGVAGVVASRPPRGGAEVVLTPSEAQELVERDLARWLAAHASAPRPVVFAPPNETTTLGFYGGVRGIGTLDPGNRAGFEATLMITAAATMEEAQAALQVRGVRYIVVPSWDPFFDDFATRYLAAQFAGRRSLLADELRRWHLPGWLRPLAYQMPEIGGFEQASVLVFEVVEDQSPAAAASRLTEYLIETGRLGAAAASGAALQHFPADVGALEARAQLLAAQGESGEFAATIATLRTRIATGADRYLPWDRRASLAATLAQGNELAAARRQLGLCLGGVTPQRLRTLTPGSLYRLLVLTHAFAMPIADPQMQAQALALLPPALRAQL